MVSLRIASEMAEERQRLEDEYGNPSSLSVSSEAVSIGLTDGKGILHVSGSAPIDANDGQLILSEPGGKALMAGRTEEYCFVQSHNRDPLALNPIGNSVGVGTTDPQSTLHVSGDSPPDANSAQLRITEPRGRALMLGRNRAYCFVQSHNNAPLALNPIGNNVGIGTASPQEKLEVDGNIRVTGDVLLTGADCAERFEVDEVAQAEPATVMVIGKGGVLSACVRAYDRRVAGVVSGGGDRRPALILAENTPQSTSVPLALSGTAYCKVDASLAAIEVGDLLTTATTPGHAMRATDATKAFGAVIGKALAPASGGLAMIPILIALN